MTGSYFFALGVLVFVIGGGFTLLRAAQRHGLELVRAKPIRVVAYQSLGVGARVVMIEADGARVLLGVSKAGVSFLSCRAREQGVTDVDDNVASFSTVLKRAGSWR